MEFHKDILGTTVGLQSIAVMGRAVSLIPKGIGKVKDSSKNLTKGFLDISVGTALIGPTASMVGKL